MGLLDELSGSLKAPVCRTTKSKVGSRASLHRSVQRSAFGGIKPEDGQSKPYSLAQPISACRRRELGRILWLRTLGVCMLRPQVP
jgi:hypothetical protein